MLQESVSRPKLWTRPEVAEGKSSDRNWIVFCCITMTTLLLLPTNLTHNNLMWRTVGTLSSPNNKSKEESAFEPFGHASKLKLNQSQLSGENSPYFMQHYFSKKRSMQSIPRSHSQKSIDLLQFHSPPSSLRDIVVSPPKKELDAREQGRKEPSIASLDQRPSYEPIKALGGPKGTSSRKQSLGKGLQGLKNDYKQMKMHLQEDFRLIKSSLQDVEGQILCKLRELQFLQEVKKKEGVNPQVVNRIRQQSHVYNERVREIEARKAQVREKYRHRKQNNAG